MRTRLLFVSILALAFAAGCGNEGNDGGDPGSEPATAEGELRNRAQLDDNALKGKLAGILRDVSFTSESDYGYEVLEGDRVEGGRLTKKLVREKLREAVKTKSSDHRDIGPDSVRAVRIDVSKAINDGDQVVVPTDREDDDYVYARHDRQLGIALKTMRQQTKGVVAFTFGTNESGDGDGGNVLYVYAGISKTTGKIIAIMTEAVYT